MENEKIESKIEDSIESIPHLFGQTHFSTACGAIGFSINPSYGNSDFREEVSIQMLNIDHARNLVDDSRSINRGMLSGFFSRGAESLNKIPASAESLWVRIDQPCQIAFRSEFFIGGIKVSDVMTVIQFTISKQEAQYFAMEVTDGMDPVKELCIGVYTELATKLFSLDWSQLKNQSEFSQRLSAICSNLEGSGQGLRSRLQVLKIRVIFPIPAEIELLYKENAISRLTQSRESENRIAKMKLQMEVADLLNIKSKTLRLLFANPEEWEKYLVKIFALQEKMMEVYRKTWDQNEKDRQQILIEYTKDYLRVPPDNREEVLQVLNDLHREWNQEYRWMYDLDRIENNTDLKIDTQELSGTNSFSSSK